MKKLLCLILVLCMALSLIACTQQEADIAPVAEPEAAAESAAEPEAAAEPEPEPEPEEPAEITAIVWALNGVPAAEDIALMNEKLNEITLEKINTKVDFQIWDIGTYIGTAATAVSAGENIDLMCTFPAAAPHFNAMSAQNMLLPLDDLLKEYGQGILDLIPETWWKGTTVGGQILGVPTYANKSNDFNIMFKKGIFEELGFKAEDVKTLDDIHTVLAAFHEKYPDDIALTGDNLSLDITYPGFDVVNSSYYDALGDSTAVAAIVPFTADGTTDYKIVSRYETEGFNTLRKTIQAWYAEGLVDKDTPTYSGHGYWDVFAQMSVTAPSVQATRNITIDGGERIAVKLMDGSVGTAGLRQFTWALPVSCDEPAAAMKLMNLLYTDADVFNLINHGVEGVHYVLNADGQMDYPEGMTADTATWHPGMMYVGNTLIGYTRAGTDPTIPEKEVAAISSSIPSPLLGFAMDMTPVADIYTQLSTIAHDEYGPFVFTGAASDAQYEEFIQKLYENGLEQFMAEAQTQLDAWLAAQ